MSTAAQYNSNAIADVMNRYEAGAKAFSDLVQGIPAELLDIAAEGEWSVRQTAMHIVDAELVGATRLRMIAAQPGSKLPAYAGDVWARELGYTQQPLGPALQLFEALRRSTGILLRQLPAVAWSNRAQHEEAGEVTLESYLESHCGHAESHMHEIRTLLGRISSGKVQATTGS